MSEDLLPAFEPIVPTPYELPATSRWRRKAVRRGDGTVDCADTDGEEFSSCIRRALPLAGKEAILEAIEQLGRKFGTQSLVTRAEIEATIVVVALQEVESIVNQLAPAQLVEWLNMLHVGVDCLAHESEMITLSNNGFEFQLVTGHFTGGRADEATHADRALYFALAFVPYISRLVSPLQRPLTVKIGIHSGVITSNRLQGPDWAMFRLFGEDAHVAPLIIEQARVGHITATMPFVESLKEKWEWFPTGMTVPAGYGRSFRLVELKTAYEDVPVPDDEDHLTLFTDSRLESPYAKGLPYPNLSGWPSPAQQAQGTTAGKDGSRKVEWDGSSPVPGGEGDPPAASATMQVDACVS